MTSIPLRISVIIGGENMITVERLRAALNDLDDALNDRYIHVIQGFDGTYLILEKELDCREGREVIKIK